MHIILYVLVQVIKTRPLQGSQHNESLSSGHGTLTVKTAFGHDSIPVSEVQLSFEISIISG